MIFFEIPSMKESEVENDSMMNVSVDGNCILLVATAAVLLCSSRYTCTTRVLGIGTTSFVALRIGDVVDGGAGGVGTDGDDTRDNTGVFLFFGFGFFLVLVLFESVQEPSSLDGFRWERPRSSYFEDSYGWMSRKLTMV